MNKLEILVFATEEESRKRLSKLIGKNKATADEMQQKANEIIYLAKLDYLRDKPWGGMADPDQINLSQEKLTEILADIGKGFEMNCVINLYAFEQDNNTKYGCSCGILNTLGEIISQVMPEVQIKKEFKEKQQTIGER